MSIHRKTWAREQMTGESRHLAHRRDASLHWEVESWETGISGSRDIYANNPAQSGLNTLISHDLLERCLLGKKIWNVTCKKCKSFNLVVYVFSRLALEP